MVNIYNDLDEIEIGLNSDKLLGNETNIPTMMPWQFIQNVIIKQAECPLWLLWSPGHKAKSSCMPACQNYAN